MTNANKEGGATPRTNAAAVGFAHILIDHEKSTTTELVDANFARTLERELEAVRVEGDAALAYAVKIPDGLHVDTASHLLRFTQALAEKLRAAEKKYGYSDGWLTTEWKDECIANMHKHIAKGDPRDVANYCMFLWARGWATEISPRELANEGYRKHLAEQREELVIKNIAAESQLAEARRENGRLQQFLADVHMFAGRLRNISKLHSDQLRELCERNGYKPNFLRESPEKDSLLAVLQMHHDERLSYSTAKRKANATCAEFQTNPLKELIESGYLQSKLGQATIAALSAGAGEKT